MLENNKPQLLQDQFGRVIDYIRISVTDRCNLRCIYCMPSEGVVYRAHDEIISYEDIVRLVKILAKVGLRKVKLTGGEPLVRPRLDTLVAMLMQIPQIEDVTLTTNGFLLDKQMDGLYKAGVRSVNISVDALDPQLQKEIVRSTQSLDIKNLTTWLLQYPDLKLKVNVVPIKGVNEQELPKLVQLAKENNMAVRFIELMPIGLGKTMEFLGEEELKKLIAPVTGTLYPTGVRLGHGPCSYFTSDKLKGQIGFISALSHKFCDSCNRVRITSQGDLKTCLQYDSGVHLLAPMKAGASDEELLTLIQGAIYKKPKEHHFENTDLTDGEKKTMAQIGG